MKKNAKRISVLAVIAGLMIITGSAAYAEDDLQEVKNSNQVQSNEEIVPEEASQKEELYLTDADNENPEDYSNDEELDDAEVENNVIDENLPGETDIVIDHPSEVTGTPTDNQEAPALDDTVVVGTITEEVGKDAKYSVAFESPDGKRFSIDGGTQMDLRDIISQLWDDVPSEEMLVDESSIDGNCYKIENNIFSDLGPFVQADRNLVVTIGDKRYEIRITDPVTVSGISDLSNGTGQGTETDPIIYELTNNTDLTGTIYFQQKAGTATTTYYVFDLKNYELTRNVACTEHMISISANVNITIKDGTISGNGSNITANTYAINVADADLVLSNVTIKDCKLVENRVGSAIGVNGNSSLSMISCSVYNNSCTTAGQGTTICVLGSGDTINVDISGTATDPTKIYDNEGNGLVAEGTVMLKVNQYTEFSGNTGHDSGAIYVLNGVTAILDGTSIINNTGTNSGGLCAYQSNVVIKNSEIRKNKSSIAGGISSGEGTIKVSNSKVYENESDGVGGGLYVYEGNLEIDNSEIYSNSAVNNGSAVYAIDCDKVIIKNSKIHSNNGCEALFVGEFNTSRYTTVCEIDNVEVYDTVSTNANSCGGIAVVDVKTATINNSKVYNNSLGYLGAGIYGYNCKMYIKNSSIYNNEANQGGGGLYLDSADVTIENSDVYGNTCHSTNGGGGIYTYNSSLILENSRIYNNTSSIGGGIASTDSNIVITNSEIYNNSAQGGGVSANSGSMKIVTSKLYNNDGGPSGGGISSYDCDLEISDAEIYNNTAHWNGGGICYTAFSTGTLKISSTKIYNNEVGKDLTTTLIPEYIAQMRQGQNYGAFGGGGLSVSYGTAELTGVEIYGNNANDLYGGGIHSINNQTVLKNTNITNNATNYDGAGMFVKYNSNCIIGTSVTQIEESTVVYDNTKNGTQNNVFLTSGTILNLDNLSKDAKIGVSTEEIAVYEAPITISAGETESYEYAFISDSQDFYISNPQSEGKYLIKLCAYKTDSPAAYISLLKDEDEEEEDEEETEDAEESEEEETVAIANDDLNPGNLDSAELERAKAERKAKIVKTVWFTINLLATIITVAISALTFVGKNKSSNMGLKLLSLIPAISLILMLVLSYPYGGTDTVADGYTLVFVVTTAIQCGIGYLAWKNVKIH